MTASTATILYSEVYAGLKAEVKDTYVSSHANHAPSLSHKKPVYNLTDFKSLPLWLSAQ
jgi:hypothetical protein